MRVVVQYTTTLVYKAHFCVRVFQLSRMSAPRMC